MLVNRNGLHEVIKRFSASGVYGLDTETTGLHEKDKLFSIILSDNDGGVYFNFLTYSDLSEEWCLPREWLFQLAPIFTNPESLFFIHNAKFDMGMLAKEGLEISGRIHCTASIERVLQNNYLGHEPYSLASCAKRRGWQKDDAVEKYVKEHKCFSKIKIPGKEKLFVAKHYDKVPWQIMVPYGIMDAELVKKIGQAQLNEAPWVKFDNIGPNPEPLYQNELALTKVCFKLERTGIKIDREYTEKALEAVKTAADRQRRLFQAQTTREFADSASLFKEIFSGFGIELPKTAKGNISVDKKVLDSLEHPVADTIRRIRGFEKLSSTYYSSFLYFADERDKIHANIRQGGTETGRFSYSDPNLQNLPKEDEESPEGTKNNNGFLVRRCFIPSGKDFCFVAIDFKQQEFRMMLDYAGEKEMIAKVMDGLDVHEATGEQMGVTRKTAKTLNFGLLYGMGAPKLAKSLGVPADEGYGLWVRYFNQFPGISRFIRKVKFMGENRGFIFNWFGFRNHIDDTKNSYILPNHLIQGGCAQVIRVAMTRLDAYITMHKLQSRMVAQVHDELLFEVHKDEFHHVAQFQSIMENVYPSKNGMKLLCSVEHSWESWAKIKMIPGTP